ncbi:thymidine phosphorylase [Micromonospora sp. C95]|uniref:thymidine phosphorylase n=1 Tax=Micromonospora sp. C95 TaxID=2824882 RepID=UPI001B36EABE|nr:thymidine phosphorylase [Micromonospora sp. C95]MBQ1026071.1 thymidine phosphorylase [Micromonospora sp. C95]
MNNDANSPSAVRRIIDAIADLRAGRPLDGPTIRGVVDDYLAGRVTDYQMSAWLATVACTGLRPDETAALAMAYVDSGRRLTHPGVGRVVDKHSTGGVGDKVSLFVVPVVAACGVPVVKVSGRGLGFMGGTVDKLESLAGLRLDLSAGEVADALKAVGMVITGQSDEVVPGDRATYALRDVTGTVDSMPLIAASVMSKKIATGADAVVLDVKCGEGALVPDLDAARTLARLMIDIGRAAGVECQAVLTDMNRPLGRAVGNAAEVREAISALQGDIVPGYHEVCRQVAVLMVSLGRPNLSTGACEELVEHAVASGAALRILRRWVEYQGGDIAQIDDPDLLPSGRHEAVVRATEDGWVTGIGPTEIGKAALWLGAGRFQHEAPLDHGAAVLLDRQVGERVAAGEPLARLVWNDGRPDEAEKAVRAAFRVGRQPPEEINPVLDVVNVN